VAQHLKPEHFDANAREALRDDHLRGALEHATDLFGERRKAAIGSVPDWEDLRERARSIKAAVLTRLDHYLAQFVEQAEANGIHVHWARSGDEACSLIEGIAQSLDAKTIVKSKSMTTEEIHLNAALERKGFRPVETDLGEWIIQLADEVPSHIIVPAIHKTKEDVARLFTDKLSVPETTDPAELTAVARKVLREDFSRADLGITGVNFAVAETGSFLVLENEGNARMTATLPRVHVAVMGIEKVIPRLSDLELFLKLLPRSGTGQHLTSYQTLFSGPRRAGDEDGPEAVHIVLLDNGRSSMLQSAVKRQSLACIRCGACLNACPVYRQVGGHAYGSVYPGPIGAVITPQMNGFEKNHQLPYASSLCGACRDVCPVKIDIPAVLLDLRAGIARGDGITSRPDQGRPVRRGERLGFRIWAAVARRPRLYRCAAWVVRATAPLQRSALAAKLNPYLRGWTNGRALPRPAKEPFRMRWQRRHGGRS